MIRFRIQKRANISAGKMAALVIVSVAVVMALLALVFWAVGVNPGEALWLLASSSFSSGYAFSEVLVKTTPIIFTGLACAVGLRMKLWNIGAEGQLYAGAMGAVWVAQTFKTLPAAALLPLMMLAAIACGCALGGIVGFVKKSLNVSEILTSLMFNYIMIAVVNYLVYGPWKDPDGFNFPITPRFVEAAWLPQFFGTRLHLGFFLALLFAALTWLVIEKTSWGYEIRATGESLGGAKYVGINIGRNILLVFMICGAMAAMAGMCEVAGIHHKLQQGNLSAGYGNLGVIAAWLAGANPLALVGVAGLVGIMLIGVDAIQVGLGVSTDVVQIILGLIMVGVLCCQFFKGHTIVMEQTKKEVAAP